LLQQIFPGINTITGVDYDQRTGYIAVVGNDSEAGRLFITDAGEAETPLDELDTGFLSTVAWGSDDTLAVGRCVQIQPACDSNQIALVNWKTHTFVDLPGLLSGAIAAIEFDRSGRYLAATNGAVVRVWSTETHQQVALLADFSPLVSAMKADGHLLAASSGFDGNLGVTLWDTDSLASVGYIPCRGAVDLHENLLACGNEIWEIDKAQLSQSISDVSDILDVAFNPEGTRLAISSDNGNQIVLWDVGQQRIAGSVVLDDLRLTAVHIDFSADGHYLFSFAPEEPVLVWEVAQLEQTPISTVIKLDEDFSLSPNLPITQIVGKYNKTFLAGPQNADLLLDEVDGTLWLYDPSHEMTRYVQPFWGWYDVIFPHPLAFDPSGKFLATAGCTEAPHGGFCTASMLALLDGHSGELLVELPRDQDRVMSLALSADGQRLFTGHDALDSTWNATVLPSCSIHDWQINH
jgi:WD40 repeat protein